MAPDSLVAHPPTVNCPATGPQAHPTLVCRIGSGPAVRVLDGGVADRLTGGVYQLLHPQRLAVLELASWRTVYRRLRTETRGRDVGLRVYTRRSSDPTPTTVFYDDTAAVIRTGFAAAGLVLHQVTGSALPDAADSAPASNPNHSTTARRARSRAE